MKTKKLVTILLVLGCFMAVAGTSSANVISFSDNVNFDHDQVVTTYVYDCPASLTYTFLSDTVSLSQFDPGLGILKSVELIVESTIDVETYYWYAHDYHTTSQHWYSDVVGSVNGLQATFSQDHNHHTTGHGYYNHVFSIDGTASDSASSGLAAFIGTGTVDVDIIGDNMLCAWWNDYLHKSTSTGGTVTVKLIYNYTIPNSVDSCLTVMDDLSMFVPCAEYEGTGFSFMLNYFVNPDDPDRLYWKMDLNTFALSTSTPCINVNSDLSLVIPCASFIGAGYGFGFKLDFYPNPSDPHNLYPVRKLHITL